MLTVKNIYKEGRLAARPGNQALPADFQTGFQTLQLVDTRDGLLYIPRGYTHDQPAALAVMLHGAGGEAEHGLQLLRSYADEQHIILLAPASRHATWDIIARNTFNADVV